MENEEDPPSTPGPPKEPPPSPPPLLPLRPLKMRPPPPIPVQELVTFDLDQVDREDEISHQMTGSYSEISFGSTQSPDVEIPSSFEDQLLQDQISRPLTLPYDITHKPLGPLVLEGSVHKEGNMTHFVAEDLEYKIKLSSPQAKKGDTPPLPGSRSCTPSTLYRQLLVPQINQIDVNLLNDMECEAQRMATSIDNLVENLCGILHSISSITADNVDVYKNAVSKMSNSMDTNIKSMYTMMAKTEEITQAMKSVHIHAARLKEIKRLVDLFETYVS